MSTTLITNAIVFTVDAIDRIYFNGAVAIRDGRIEFVGPAEACPIAKADRIIDGMGRMALIPGLIDVHSHSSLLRGFSENAQLLDWLPEYQLEHQVLTEEDAYAAALLCYLESVKGGTTCVMDMYRYMHRCADAALEIGIRINLVPYVATAPGKDFFETIESNQALVKSHHMKANGKVRVWLGMEHLFYCTPETYLWAAAYAHDHQLGIHTHTSEQQEEVAAVVKHFGKRPIHLFQERGILGPRTVIAHCVWLNDEEISIMADTGTSVAHCPVSNAKLASGIARIPEMQAAGITIGLGSDGPISNNSLDIFEEMKFGSLLQKTGRLDARVLSAREMLRMATINGAKLLGLDGEIGSIEKGKRADLALVDLWAPHLMPIIANETDNCVLWNLVFAARGSDVHSVFVDGDLIVDNRKSTRVDEAKVLDHVMKQTHSLLKRRAAVKSRPVAATN